MLRRGLLFALSFCLFIGGAVPDAWAQPAAVARVAVAVGETLRVAPGGQTQALQVGSSLTPGDRVRTGPDAVAILVFSDEGRISLRSDSELLIRHYEIDPAGAKTRIELELIKGTVRQISGNAARQQPERYRLNTPIAVIGVRGTDFLAKSSADAVEAFVHEGNIVLIPLAGACVAAPNAACTPLATVSAAADLRYVRLNAAGQLEQRDFRPGELERVFGVEVARSGRGAGMLARSGSQPAGDFQLPAGTQFITDTIFAAGAADRFVLPSLVSPSGVNASPVDPVDKPPAAPVVSTIPVAEGAAPVAQLSRPLVWGRFSSAGDLATSLLVPFAEAVVNRHVTVGELGQYALWRSDPSGRLDSSLKGAASFALDSAQAWFVQPASTSAALVNGASLNVDFDQSTFAASVSMSHAVGGDASLDVTGKVNVEGVFVGIKGSERVAGALTRDGKEAGYLFSKDVANGTFRGITLWGRK
jgi:hypothetical protein